MKKSGRHTTGKRRKKIGKRERKREEKEKNISPITIFFYQMRHNYKEKYNNYDKKNKLEL